MITAMLFSFLIAHTEPVVWRPQVRSIKYENGVWVVRYTGKLLPRPVLPAPNQKG